MKKDKVKDIITDWVLRKPKATIAREIELPTNINKVVSIIGPRRCGKTYMLFDLVNKLSETHPRENLIYINFEDDRLFPFSEESLDNFLTAYYELYPDKKNETVYFFFDEIQDVPNWEKFIRRIYDTEDCRIYITGSSSKLLSKEIATSLRGRTLPFEAFPLSFSEFLGFKNIKASTTGTQQKALVQNALSEYIEKGSYPETVDLDKYTANRVLNEYIDLVIYRDLADRYAIKNTKLLKYLIKHLFVNMSNPLSINKLFNDLKSQGYSIGKNTLYDFMGYLEDAFIFFNVQKHSKSEREKAVNPNKVYGIDTGMRQAFVFAPDYGRMYENTVYLHLRRKTEDIHYYLGKQEVDFYMEGEQKLINVCYDLDEFSTRQRELKGLNEAMKYYGIKESLLITNDDDEDIKTENGWVRILPMYKWLLQKDFLL
ncbi:MAG: ATP-binding protein [Bacteroidia bacterium]